MRYFVFGDIHGNDQTLEALLREAGVIASDDTRPEQINGESFEVISIGDLWHVGNKPEDQAGDASTVEFIEEGFIDKMVIGNHELPLVFEHIQFRNYLDNPPLGMYFRALIREHKAVPVMLIGSTLITHAGVAEVFDWESPEEAFDDISETFFTYPSLIKETEYKNWEIIDGPRFNMLPKRPYRVTLINGIGSERGGSLPYGGVFWHDWKRSRNKRFNQIMGHTPLAHGPSKIDYPKYGTWHMNIDIGAKRQGFPAYGVWLDESGEVVGEVRSPWSIEVMLEMSKSNTQ